MGALALDNALLLLGVASLAVAGHRIATRLSDDRLPRLLAAATFAAAAAVLEALGLGLVGASGSAVALAGTGAVCGAAVISTVPAGPRSPPLSFPGTGAGLALGGAAGGLLAVAAIELHRPVLGQDAITYHLPEVIGWVQSGHTGRVLHVYYGLPVGNYPVTAEVLLAWAAGLAHSWAAILLITLATVPLLGLAGWLVLRDLGVTRAAAGLGLATFLAVPLVTQAWVEPGNDLEATAWLAATVAFCRLARREPRLLGAAVVAAGLAVGTKTTTAAYVVVALGLALWSARATLRGQLRPLLVAGLVAAVVGLLWYGRNLVEHGSPLWPFSSFPAGDPRPALIAFLSNSLLHTVHATLIAHLHGYLSGLSGGTVLLVGGGPVVLVVGLVARRRALALAGLVTTLGTLLYAAGPVTGAPPRGGEALLAAVGSTLRYLMPAWAAGTTALALLAADRDRRLAALGWLGLLGALGWSLGTDIGRHFSLAFSSWLWFGLALGALVGVGAGAGVGRTSIRALRPTAIITGAVMAGLVALAVLTLGSRHFSLRHAATGDYAADLTAALDGQPGWSTTHAPVATVPAGLAALAGDRFEHPLNVIGARATCAEVAATHARSWIVIGVPPTRLTPQLRRVTVIGTAFGCLARAHERPIYADGAWLIFPPSQPAGHLS